MLTYKKPARSASLGNLSQPKRQRVDSVDQGTDTSKSILPPKAYLTSEDVRRVVREEMESAVGKNTESILTRLNEVLKHSLEEVVRQVKEALEHAHVHSANLGSHIMDSIKVELMPQIFSLIEDAAQKAVQRTAENQSTALNRRFSSDSIEARDMRNLQLQFRTRICRPIFTGRKLAGEDGAAIQIALIDVNTGHVVTDGPESSVMLEIVVLHGDFTKKDSDDWSQEEFENHTVMEREGKRPLLTGVSRVMLKQGTCMLDDLTITDNSSWNRSGKFIIGARVASGSCEGIRIREAITEALTIKENRGELYRKCYPPKSEDEVWRLEKIAKGGPYHKALNSAGIYTVQDLLQLLARDEKRLRSIFGNKMAETKWGALIKHAKTCLANGKIYTFSVENMCENALVFNNLGQLTGLIADTGCYTTDKFSDDQKMFADYWVNKAYENWNLVTEITGEDLLCPLSGRSGSGQAVALGSLDHYSIVPDNHLTVPSVPMSVGPPDCYQPPYFNLQEIHPES